MANPIFHSQYTAQQIEDLITNGAPIVGQNGHWWRWNVSAQQYEDTGVTADSETAADAAEAAQAAAEFAQGKAEDAQDAAETAQGLAESARDAAAGSAASIAQSAAQIDANTARIGYLALREEEDRQILFGSVVQAVEDTYDELRSAPIHTAITIGQSVYPRMDNTRMAIDKLLGRTVAWNQLLKPFNSSGTDAGVTWTYENGVGTVSAASATAQKDIQLTAFPIRCNANHKYLIAGFSGGSSSTWMILFNNYGWLLSAPTIKEASVSAANNVLIRVFSGATFSGVTISPFVIDLTLMFGSAIADYIYGLETATAGAGVAYVRQRLDLDYYAYNTGELTPPVVSGVTVSGFNAWDESWENGSYNITTGAKIVNSATIRNKNPIPIISNTTYFFKCPTIGARMLFYSEDAYIGTALANNVTFVTPSNAKYMAFYMGSTSNPVRTYNHDICINISNASLNGQYRPYVAPTSLSLPSTMLDGVGSAQDTMYIREDGENDYALIKRSVMIEVDLGTLNYTEQAMSNNRKAFYTPYSGLPAASADEPNVIPNAITPVALPTYQLASSWPVGSFLFVHSLGVLPANVLAFIVADTTYADAAAFKASMSGKYLCYEKATPIETVIASHLTLAEVSAIAENGGIISIVNSNGEIVQPDAVFDTVISRSAQ